MDVIPGGYVIMRDPSRGPRSASRAAVFFSPSCYVLYLVLTYSGIMAVPGFSSFSSAADDPIPT